MTKLLLALIRLYQLALSPLLGNVCRFEPSCSRYMSACITLHGPLRGGWLGLKRLGRCHPFHAGGYDPPPGPVTGVSSRARETARFEESFAADTEFRAPFSAARRDARAPISAARSESSCHTECRAHGCSR